MSAPELEELAVGQELPSLRIEVDRARLVAYADASGDQNPIHQDEEVARSVGLPDVIAHGMFTMGAAMEAVSAWAGDPARVLACSTRFTRPVVVPADGGAVIEVAATVKALDAERRRASVALTVTSGGAAVLGRASATVQCD